MVNVDSLLQDIHLLWDDMETNDIVEFQTKRLDNAESKEDPNVMLIDDILMEEKFRDGVLVFMNDRRDKSADKKRKCKEVSGFHTMRKKRSAKKKNELVQTTESPSTEDNGSKDDDDDMEVEETSKEDSSEEMDTESSSNNEQCAENIWIICILYLDNCMVLCVVFVGKATLTSMSLELFICDSFAPIF